MTVTLDDLAGPADADMFRMTVDWGRWYIDPLPTCSIAEATEDRWPSCTTVKKAADKDWSFLTVNRIAALEPAELHRIADLDHTQRGDAVRSHEKFAKNVAFGRGTIVHLWAEDLAAGKEPRQITDGWLAANGYPTAARTESMIYRNALIDFFQTYQPELVAAEYVTIHRTLNGKGYGATPDGLFKIEGEVVAVDWKTRGESSSHAAYPEEAAQIACGVMADYMIVRVDDHAERRIIRAVDGGYVVSIKPDGARLYPIDIEKAWDHWCRLHQWWVWKQDEKASIGRVKAKRSAPKNGVVPERPNGDAATEGLERAASATTAPPGVRIPPTPLDWRLVAKRRYSTWSDQEKLAYTERKKAIDTSDPTAVFALMDEIDAFNMVVTFDAFSKVVAFDGLSSTPDEGGTVDQADIDALHQRFAALNDEAQLWTGTLVAQGKATHPFNIKQRPTVRRYELYRGILAIAEMAFGGIRPDTGWSIDDVVRAIGHLVTGDDAALCPTTKPGELLASLDAASASAFARIATDLTHDRYLAVVGEDGTLRLVAVGEDT